MREQWILLHIEKGKVKCPKCDAIAHASRAIYMDLHYTAHLSGDTRFSGGCENCRTRFSTLGPVWDIIMEHPK